MKRKLLILSDWYPPSYKAGGPVQSVYRIAQLLNNQFNVSVITTNKDLNGEVVVNSELSDQWIEQDGVQVWYSSSRNSFVKLKGIIASLQPQSIYINGLFTNSFKLLQLWLVRKYRGKIIIGVRGMLKPSAFKFHQYRKKGYLYLLQFFGLNRKVLFHATTSSETSDIKNTLGNEVSVVEIANIPYQFKEIPSSTKTTPLKLVFASRIHPIKNLKLALECLSQTEYPVDFDIIGVVDDEGYYKECLKHIKTLPKNIKVNIVNGLNHADLMKRIQDKDVYILPTLGENFGHSIYEALSAGLPVIISDQTPWRNLKESQAGFDIPLDQSEAFTAAIEKFCLMDNSEFSTWRLGARKLAEDFIQEQDYLNQYSELFRSYKKVGLVSPLPLTRYKGGISVFTNKILAETNDFKQEGVQLIHLNTCVIPRTNESSGRVNLINFRNYIRFLWKTYRSIQRNDIRQLHVHSSTGFSLLKDTFTGWLFSKLLSTQNILNIHYAEKESIFYKNWGYKLSKYFIKNGFREVIVLGQDIKQLFVEIGFPKDKIHILSYFHRKSLAARINKQPIERVSLLFLGSLDERKGVLDVLEALCEVPDSNWSLNIAGQFITSAFEADFMNSSSYARLKHKINLLGYIDGVAKEELLQASDILVLPSHGEGLPVSILEALFYDVAIITSNVGANKEHLNDICNLLEPGNISQLAEELNRAISDSVYLNERKKQGKSLSENYTFTAYKKEIIPIYQEL
mgnify:CR=1 FL=1